VVTPSKAKYVHESDSEQVKRGKVEKYFEERVQEHVKLPRGKRIGPHEPAGRIQLRLLGMSRCADTAGFILGILWCWPC